MNRRKFLLASGSTILTGSALGSFRRPALGLELELSAVPNREPKNIDSLLIEFTNLEITPFYLDEGLGLDITVKLDIEGEDPVEKSVSGLSFANGQTIDKEKIQTAGKDLSQIVIDGLDKSGSNLRGNIFVRVSHEDISAQTYNKSFNINRGNIDFVYADVNNNLFSYNAFSGDQNWSQSFSNPVEENPTIKDGQIYFTTLGNTLYSVNVEDGSTDWSTSIGGVGSPTIIDGVVYIANESQNLKAIDKNTGSELWSVELTSDRVSYPHPVAVDNGQAICASDQEYIQAVDIDSQTVEWSTTLPNTEDSIETPPVLTSDKVFCADSGNNIHAFNRQDGSVIWSASTNSSPTAINLYNGVLYISEFGMTAIDTNGNQLWNSDVGGGNPGAGSIADGKIMLGTVNDDVVALDINNGNVQWRFTPDLYGVRATGSIYNNSFYVVTTGLNDNAKVHVLDISDGSEKFKTSTTSGKAPDRGGAISIHDQSDGVGTRHTQRLWGTISNL